MSLPRTPQLDSSLSLLAEGYRFISNRCERYGSPGFKARLFLNNVVCVRGADAARMFYTPDRFTRNGAVPIPTVMQLQDFGSVQSLEGEDHRHRKQLFLSLMTPARLQYLADLTARLWGAQMTKWEPRRQIVLHEEVEETLCRAICQWSGVPLAEAEVKQRTRAMAAMIDGAASIGPRAWKGLYLRSQTEHWLQGIISDVRARRRYAAEGTALHAMAWHRDRSGKLLDAQTAAVELLNVLRPTVAVARYVTFSAHALHMYPHYREALQSEDDALLQNFVQEVRRYYPFLPAIGGLVQKPFDWHGEHFRKGTWILFDLYGTNHDPSYWQDPERFRPERFDEWNGSAYNFTPQGAGEHHVTHRCPGEWITIGLTKVMVRLLVSFMSYDVPRQDLRIDLRRIPAIPKSRMILSNVRRQVVPEAALAASGNWRL